VKIDLLIVDANVLIDFCKTDRTVLTLVTAHVGTVHVAEPVLAEVKELDRATAEGLDLRIVQPDFAMLTRAANAAARSPLRFQDWLCLFLADQEGWTCVTNDKRLRVECESRGVPILWGLQLVLSLVERGAHSKKDAVQFAQAIHSVNRRISRYVIHAFMEKVKATR
jgi:rRNA-processing protein FCF1